MCIKLLSLCCEGKSDLAEVKCHAEIINLKTACVLYESSGRNWPFKQVILNYITHCYLDSANQYLFSPSYFQDNMTPLKNVVRMATHDMNVIYTEWHYPPDFDCKIIYPDKSVSSFQKEAKVLALDSVCQFF